MFTDASMNENRTEQPDRSSRLIRVASIIGAFGVQGEVRLRPFTDDPMACVEYGPLMDKAGNIILTPRKHRAVKRGIAVTAPEVKTREDAESLRGTDLYVSRDKFPEPDEDEFYYSDLIGMKVLDESGGRIGSVKAMHDFGAGDVVEVLPREGKSWYHPFTLAAVPEVNAAERYIRIIIEEAENGKEPEKDEEPEKPAPVLNDLYNDEILALASTLKNEKLSNPDGTSRKVSKLCGSWLEIDVDVEAGVVAEYALRVQACALGQASAAILGESIVGAGLEDIEAARGALYAMLKEDGEPPTGRFAKLSVLAGVRDYRARHTSTMLAFDAAVEAVESALQAN